MTGHDTWSRAARSVFFTDHLRKNEPYSHKENTARLSSLVIFAVSAVIFGVVLALVLIAAVSGIVLTVVVTVVIAVIVAVVIAVVAAVILALVLLIIHIVVLRHEKYLLKCLFSNYTHSMVRFI